MFSSIINATPHDIQIAAVLAPGQRRAYSPRGWRSPARAHAGAQHVPTFVVTPSGLRLPCRAVTEGPDLGCSVRYELTEQARREQEAIWLAFGSLQGSDMIVIASEISVRALAGTLNRNDEFPIRAMWPVLAHESLSLPMGERWADKLATLSADSRA